MAIDGSVLSPTYEGNTPAGLSVVTNNPSLIHNEHFDNESQRISFAPVNLGPSMDRALMNENGPLVDQNDYIPSKPLDSRDRRQIYEGQQEPGYFLPHPHMAPYFYPSYGPPPYYLPPHPQYRPAYPPPYANYVYSPASNPPNNTRPNNEEPAIIHITQTGSGNLPKPGEIKRFKPASGGSHGRKRESKSNEKEDLKQSKSANSLHHTTSKIVLEQRDTLNRSDSCKNSKIKISLEAGPATRAK